MSGQSSPEMEMAEHILNALSSMVRAARAGAIDPQQFADAARPLGQALLSWLRLEPPSRPAPVNIDPRQPKLVLLFSESQRERIQQISSTMNYILMVGKLYFAESNMITDSASPEAQHWVRLLESKGYRLQEHTMMLIPPQHTEQFQVVDARPSPELLEKFRRWSTLHELSRAIDNLALASLLDRNPAGES